MRSDRTIFISYFICIAIFYLSVIYIICIVLTTEILVFVIFGVINELNQVLKVENF